MKRANWVVLIILGLTLLAFGLRVYRVEAMSIWTDEGLSIYRARLPLLENLSNRIMIQDTPTIDTHPPLYFVLLSGWIKLAGDTEFALRFLSVLCGALIVPLGYVTGKRLFTREVGVWFAALLTLSPFYWWYARDARMYTLLAVWALLGIYLIASGLQTTPLSRLRLIGGALCLSAAALTHYTGVLLVALVGIWLLIVLWRRQRRWAFGVIVILGAAVIPTLFFFLNRVGTNDFPIYRPFQEMLFEAWNVFSLGFSRVQMRPLEQLIVFPLVGFIGLLGLALRREWTRLIFLLTWLLLPLVAFYLISLLKPAYVNPRNLSVALPAYWLCVAVGLAALRRVAWPLAAIAAVTIAIEFGTTIYQQATDPAYVKDDIRALVKYIQEHQQPGDGVILHDAIIGLTFDYYNRGALPVQAIPHYGTYADLTHTIGDLKRAAQQYDRIWFVDQPAPIGFPRDFIPNWIDANWFKLQGKGFAGNYTGAYVELSQTHSPALARLPADAQTLAAHSPEITLAGIRVPHQSLPANEHLLIDTYWQAESQFAPIVLIQELIDSHGNPWAHDEEKLWEYYPRELWPSRQPVAWRSELSLPIGLPPGTYQLRLRAVNGKTGLPVRFDSSDENDYLALGPLTIERPAQPWTHSDLREGLPVDATLSEALQLWAIAPPANVIRPGLTFTLDLIWHATRNLNQDYRFKLEVLAPDGQVIQTIDDRVGGEAFSSAQWRAGDVVRQRPIVWLPPAAVGGDYPLRLQVFDPSGQAITDQVGVGALHVEEYPLQTTPPPLEIERRAQFAEPIELLGANLSKRPYSPGSRVDVDLIWRATGKPAADYTVFLQLWDANGNLAGQGDSDPVNGLRLTSSWRPTEVIVDRHTIPLKSDLLPGTYTLYTGLYRRDTGDRVAVKIDGTTPPERWVKLGEITIEP